MESIREIYRIGYGPSSSHTMGPRAAADTFLGRVPDAASYVVTLFGSLAATGKGHLTDATLRKAFHGRTLELISKPDVFLPRHPNALTFEAKGADGRTLASWTAYSVGGGKVIDDSFSEDAARLYPFASMDAVMAHCEKNGRHRISFDEVVEVMKMTGRDLSSCYKETARGGWPSSRSLPPSESAPACPAPRPS